MNTSPRFATLQEWLAWQQGLHPKAVDLGLERLTSVMQRMGLAQPEYTVITVGGTNGKGSCVAMLESILRAGHYHVGAYTSPHLLRYNERIRINGLEISDAELCRAFARIDAARADISLTFFEFGTLAAFDIFSRAEIDVAVLEVGLGGRLDAVNALDADAALITTIDIDHVDWLGPDRASIGYEKAGIYRAGKPAICADPQPPSTLLEHAHRIGAKLYLYNKDYGFKQHNGFWTWWSDTISFNALPVLQLTGRHQYANAASVLMGLVALTERLPLNTTAVQTGLSQAHIPARFQIISGPVEWILDVAHNPQGVAILGRCLTARSCSGKTRAVVGILSDKNAAAIAQNLKDNVDQWYAVTLKGARGRTAEQLADELRTAGCHGPIACFESVADACYAAAQDAEQGDRIVVFGSFYTVAAALETGLVEELTSGQET